MSSQQNSNQIKLFTESSVMARVVKAKIKNSFPKLTVKLAKETPKENPGVTNVVIVTGIYDACVTPLTDLVVPLAIEINVVLYILFDKDLAGNMNDCYDWSVR